MTILSVIQQVTSVIALEVPTTAGAVFSTDAIREHVELRNLANEIAERIAKAHDWQALKKITTITGDGTTSAHNFPTDYDRMPKKGQLWTNSLETSLTHIIETDRWLELDVQAFDYVINAWTIFGNQIHMKPTLAATETVQYFYISNQFALSSSSVAQTEFLNDNDTFVLDERLLKLGMIWQWRANKGLPYAEDMQNYEIALEKKIVSDKGSRRLVMGQRKVPRDVVLSYPGVIQP